MNYPGQGLSGRYIIVQMDNGNLPLNLREVTAYGIVGAWNVCEMQETGTGKNLAFISYRIHRKFAPFFAQIFAKKFVKCKNLHKKLRKHLRHDYFLAFICANICTNFWVSKIFAQIFAQLFAQIFRLKNIRANFCAIICSNFWVKTNFRKFFFANICAKCLATY